MDGLLIAWRALARRHVPAGRGSILIATFAATLFMSALLLFSVQPMYAKLILPKLGGAPAVWAVAMCFFQAVLLAGYGYAYALNRWLKDGQALSLHLALLAATCLMLPFGLPAAFADPPQGEAYLWLIGLLAVGIGLPFFALAANAPLLQAWFSRTDNAHAGDPYFLYGASNFGSLIALLSYPLLLEPAIGLTAQSKVWSAGFAVLGGMIAVSGLMLLSSGSAVVVSAARTAAPASWSQRLSWIVLAFIPSGLVVAVTTYITTDVASAPFLWVLPLALFLATFILVFRAELPFRYNWVCGLLPASVLAYVLTQGWLVSSLFALASFFLAAIICHRELYNRRPASEHLTEFYLWMSVGGVLGGVFSALAAPHLFNSVFEFTLLTLLALVARPGILFGRSEPVNWRRLAAIVGAGLALMATYKFATHAGLLAPGRLYPFALIGILCLGLFLIRNWPEHRAALVFTMIAAFALTPSDHLTIHVERSFFGTHRVMMSNDGAMRMLLHGTTVHGALRLKDAAGRSVASSPATYYHPTSPMTRGVAAARAGLAAGGQTFRVGVVGLGAGSLACHSQSGEAWRFYEIDPAVVRIATDPKLFDFLDRCLPDRDIVIGDARLTLAQEPPGSFGYLVIDAFSSDSIPVHLLTVEALRLFVDKLHPDGLIALHVSNNHLDLVPALASTIALVPGAVAASVDDDRPSQDLDALSSRVVFIARTPAALAPVLQWPDARPLKAGRDRPWTDDYSDVLSALVRKLW
jgi:spermidine synthase